MIPASPGHPALARSLAFLRANWHRPIKTIDLVAASGMSRRGFIKAFHRLLGGSPGRLLRQVRLTQAQVWLRETELPVAAVAGQCGYSRVNSFVIAFKRFSGSPPQQYRRASQALWGGLELRSLRPWKAQNFQGGLHKVRSIPLRSPAKVAPIDI